MNKLVIYYSFEGNTRLIAEVIAEASGADLLELEPKKKLRSHGLFKYLWGGRQVVMKEKPKLLPLAKNPQDYDLLFIGTPVWAWTYTPPLNTFFSAVNLKNKKIALFCCHGGDKKKTLEKMRERLLGNEIISQIDFQQPIKNKTAEQVTKAKQWAQDVIVKI